MKKIGWIISLLVLCSVAYAQTPPPADTATAAHRSLITQVEQWYEHHMNYWTIAGLMVVESSFIPFPSEVVIPPAAYIACKEGAEMNIFLVVLFGTLGALLGALINYGLAWWLGRPIIYKLADSKLGHWLLLSGEKIRKSEDYFNRHGKASTFVGRFIPAIRQLISIPAGLARMPLAPFVLYTTLGVVVWNIILALLGYLAQGQADVINEYSHELSYLLGTLGALFVAYLIFAAWRKKKLTKTN